MRVIDGNFQLLVSPTTTTPNETQTLRPVTTGEEGQVGEQDGPGGDDDQGDGGELEGDGLGQAVATEEEEIHDDAKEDDNVDEEEGGDGVGMTIPPTVSRQEREQHELTHTPYRSWCRHCVRAR